VVYKPPFLVSKWRRWFHVWLPFFQHPSLPKGIASPGRFVGCSCLFRAQRRRTAPGLGTPSLPRADINSKFPRELQFNLRLENLGLVPKKTLHWQNIVLFETPDLWKCDLEIAPHRLALKKAPTFLESRIPSPWAKVSQGPKDGTGRVVALGQITWRIALSKKWGAT